MKTKEYKYIEYTDDYDFIIANVVMDGEKIVSVKLTESCLTNRAELVELWAFLVEIQDLTWKYDDNEQACEDWYTEKLRPVQISDIAKITAI